MMHPLSQINQGQNTISKEYEHDFPRFTKYQIENKATNACGFHLQTVSLAVGLEEADRITRERVARPVNDRCKV